MTTTEPHTCEHGKTEARTHWILLAFLAIAAFFLFTEHRAHLFGVLPFLLLFACPLLHFFHGGHGRHHPHEGDKHE